MAEEIQENAHSDEQGEVETPETQPEASPEDKSSENSDELAKAQKKIIELKRENKELKEQKSSDKPKGESTEETPPINKKTSDEPDYAKLAFLETKGIKHPDDQQIVQDEAERLKLPLTDVLGMAHIKSQLETNQAERKAQSGMPAGTGKGKSVTQGDVDYWLKKGGTPDDPELANKVIDARIKQDDSQKMFDDELFMGQ